MLYYALKLSGAGCSLLPDTSAPLSDPDPADPEGPDALDNIVPLETSLIPTPDIFDMPTDENVQPTLSDILHAVHKCTASMVDLKERESLLRQDLQKIREITTAVEGWVSDLEDQLPP